MFKFLLALLIFWLSDNLILAIIAYFIGSVIDRILRLGSGAINPLTNKQRQAVFLDTVFILMGKLAKVDGHISKAEIDHVEAFMRSIGLSAEHRQQAIAQFKLGASAEYPIDNTLQQFIAVCGGTHHLKQMLLVYLIVMAGIDGHTDEREHDFLYAIAQRLGYDHSAFQQLIDMVEKQTQFHQSNHQNNASPSLSDAYQALGVQADDSDAAIKRAYRKLMSEYHPDKLIGQGLPEDMVKLATERAQQIQLAYDEIKKSRQR